MVKKVRATIFKELLIDCEVYKDWLTEDAEITRDPTAYVWRVKHEGALMDELLDHGDNLNFEYDVIE